MKFLVTTLAVLLLASTARADRDPEFEAGLTSVPIQGDQVLPGPQYQRNQLVYKDTKTATTVGTAAAIGGTLSLIGGWVTYAARQQYRMRMREQLGDAVDTWHTIGSWSLTLSGFGGANISASEYLLLSGSKVTTLAWIGGVAGVAVAAIGVGFLVGGESCSPLAAFPGSTFPVGCMSATADKLFGIELLFTAAPLLNWPLSYVMRGLFAGPPESLSFNGTGLQWRGTF